MTEAITGRLAHGPTVEERDARLSAGAASLADGGGAGAALRSRHVLLAASATLMALGLAAIVLAWIGIARSTMVEEQLAYLVSGGLLGLALAIIGALTFFSHWLTALIRSNHEQTELLRELRDQERARRQEHAELLAALRARAADGTGRVTDGPARSATAGRGVRRAPRGS